MSSILSSIDLCERRAVVAISPASRAVGTWNLTRLAGVLVAPSGPGASVPFPLRRSEARYGLSGAGRLIKVGVQAKQRFLVPAQLLTFVLILPRMTIGGLEGLRWVKRRKGEQR